jgi:zinc transport system substrate-binding protein
MRLTRMHTGGEAIQAVDAVDKALLEQKIQRTVCNRRLIAVTIRGKALQHIISAHGAVAFQQDFQHAATDRRQPDAMGGGQCIGTGQHIGRAMHMIVFGKGEVGRCTGSAGGIMRGAWVWHLGGLTCYSITLSMQMQVAEKAYLMRYTISLSVASLLMLSTVVQAEVPRVMTDIPPVHALVAQVMGDLGTPELLLEKGASEHSFQLRPSQAAGLNDATLVVWIGPELTPWLERALEAVPLEVSRLGLLDAPGTITQAYGAERHDEHAGELHADEAGHAHEDQEHADAEGHADHAHEGIDPHAWLKPANAQIWLMAIAGELGRLDPENAATYSANAVAAVADVAALDAEVAAILAPAADQPVIVFHEAFGYFATRYDIHIAGAIAEGDASAPGAARIAALRDVVVAGGAVCVFPEVQHDPVMVEQMVEGTGARIGAPLDPVGSSLEPGPQLYAALITGMAQTIADCIAGP